MRGLVNAPEKGVGLVSSEHELFIGGEVDIVEWTTGFVWIYFLEID